MANKFIIEGAAFNGDGTSSAEATVAGGVGAWNTITYFEGATPAYGSLAAGDTVYIRSKTAAGANIIRTIVAATNLGSLLATAENHIHWVLDGGNIWGGVTGTLTYSATGLSISLRENNSLEAEVRGAFVYVPTTNNTLATFTLNNRCVVRGAMVDSSLQTTNGARFSATDRATLISPIVKVRRGGAGAFSTSNYSQLTVIDPDVELIGSYSDTLIAVTGIYGARIDIIGGRVWGVGTQAGASITKPSGSDSGLRILGTDIPRTVAIFDSSSGTYNHVTEYIGADGGVGAAIGSARWGVADSRSDGYYPTLNAFLPTSVAQPWSWKLHPYFAGRGRAFELPSMKLHTGDSGVKTFTCNFLLGEEFVGADASRIWIDVEYIDDATGQRKHIDSRAKANSNTPLSSSTANWSASTYGAVNLLKRQIQLTTPTSVKKDTLVVITFGGDIQALTANDLIFVCPDVVMA